MEKEAVRILEAAAQMYDVKVAIEKVGGARGQKFSGAGRLSGRAGEKIRDFFPGGRRL